MSFKQRFKDKSSSKATHSGSNHDSSAWLVSLADLLSLMLTFFVLVYSMSEIPNNKWQEYSSSIVEYMTGNKINIFKQEIKVTEKSKSKRLDAKSTSNLTYIKTLMSSMEIDEKPIDKYMDFSIHNSYALMELDKKYIVSSEKGLDLDSTGTNIFLSLSKIFQTLGNQIIINYPSKDYVESAEFSDFIARKVEEFGYEYKVLRGVFYYNANLSNEEISNKFQIVIQVNEALF